MSSRRRLDRTVPSVARVSPDYAGILATVREALAIRIAATRKRMAYGSFVRNVWVMLAGAILGQGTSVLLAPALTRLFSPEQFGYLTVYTAAIMTLSLIASLGLDVAIPIAESNAEAANLVALAGLALTATTSVVAVFAWTVPDAALLDWLGPIAHVRWLIPLGFACLGAYYVVVATATRQGQFGDIARTRITQGMAGPLSQIVFGLLGLGAPGLVIGFVWGQSAGVVYLLRRSVLRHAEMLNAMSVAGMRRVWRRYIGFPLWASWARLVDIAGYQSIFLMISLLYSPKIAGFLFLSDRVVARPLLIVSSSFLQVFTGEAGRVARVDPARLRTRFRQVVPAQTLFAIFWIALGNIAAAWLFPILFGARWDAAVAYLQAMSVAYFVLTVVHPVSTTLQMLERQVLNAAWEVGRLVVVVLTVIIGWRAGLSAIQTLWLYSAAQALCCAVLLGLIADLIERLQPARVE